MVGRSLYSTRSRSYSYFKWCVFVLSRENGSTLSTFDIASHWAFVAPETFGVELDPSALLPEVVQKDIQTVWGTASDEEQAAGFGALLGWRICR